MGKALWGRWSLIWTLKERLDLDQGRQNCEQRPGKGKEHSVFKGMGKTNWAGTGESKHMNIEKTKLVP